MNAEELRALRLEVREFLAEQVRGGGVELRPNRWGDCNREFSRSLAARGWVAMTTPVEYGGAGRSGQERWVVVEELIAAGAPLGAHWVGERQLGPMLLKFGTEEQRRTLLPKIAAAELTAALGMSESESGSDLASVRTRARPAEGGWSLTGTKIWTSNADRSDYIVVLCRTADSEDDHRQGLTQLLVDTSTAGVEIRPIEAITGEADFCEVFLDDVFVPAEMTLGEPGQGWRQITTELALERGGPDRYLSTVPLLCAFAEDGDRNEPAASATIGRLVADLVALRGLSWSLVQAVAAGEPSGPAAAIAKDAGTLFERSVPEALRAADPRRTRLAADRFGDYFFQTTLSAPAITLRGGTSEILRGIVGRQLAPRAGS